MRALVLGVVCLALCGPARALGSGDTIKVWVRLRDKGPSPLSGRAYEDAPVYAPYLQRLRQAGFTPDVTLKWQNLVSGYIAKNHLAQVAQLPMVLSAEEMPHRAPRVKLPSRRSRAALAKTSAQDFGAFQQLFTLVHAADLRATLSARGLIAGQGLRIAIIDADFALGHACFTHLWQQNAIVDQWDFVHNQPVAVTDSLGDSHGAAVLSLLAGETSDFEGLVPEAKYLLYRSEDTSSETYVEEDYVAAAFERAVDSGAQVISISLGYRYDYTDRSPNLPYADFNGRTRPSSLAALMAARRGALVSIAMGNDGDLPAPSIGAPADADSVLAVGILDANLSPCWYTSTGPTADGRIKPDVASVGPDGCATPTADPEANSGEIFQGGTSFAAPVVAGIGALLMQLHPGAAAQSIRLALMATASRAQNPDSVSGYGLVNATRADSALTAGPEALAVTRRPLDGTLLMAGNLPVYLPWRSDLIPQAVRLWDLRGRSLPVQGGVRGARFWIDSPHAAQGVYLWRIPLGAESPGP